MAIIEYIEPISIGEIFTGLSSMIVSLTLCYVLYRLYIKVIQYLDIVWNKDAKYAMLEEIYLDKHAEKVGINLEKELIKRSMLKKKSKSLQKRIHDEIIQDIFPEKKVTKPNS